MKIDQLIQNAKTSSWARMKLNFLLHRFIPFNKPHGFKIVSISENEVRVKIPYKRVNQNHLKGLHACCLATAAEYCSGFLLLHRLGMKNYRLIMESIKVSYKYQGKTEAYAIFSLDEKYFQEEVLRPLHKEGVVYTNCTIRVVDVSENLLCEAQTNWQIKQWEKVKTKLN